MEPLEIWGKPIDPISSTNQDLYDKGLVNQDPYPINSYWSSELTHRFKVLLYSKPLLDFRTWEFYCDESLKHYDALALTLKLFDIMIETMGIDREIDSGMAVQILTPLMIAMDRERQIELDPTRHELMVDRLLSKLRNDSNRGAPFQVEYTEFQGEQAIRRIFEFRLVFDAYDAEGRIILRLSDEAINLFLNALKLDIEDAQAAAEAVIQSQLARGSYSEAVSSARDARSQSIRFQDKIDSLLRDTRRDLRRVDWSHTVPHLLSTALEHIENRRVVESNIINFARDLLDDLVPGSEAAQQVARIAQLLKDCHQRHVDLHGRLIPARSVFLDEQLRQSFTFDLPTVFPNLPIDVLEPLLQASRSKTETILDSVFPTFFGARPPQIFSLTQTITWQLRPRRESQPSEVLLTPREKLMEGSDQLCYPAEVREAAQSYFEQIERPTLLSQLLIKAMEANQPKEVMEAIALIANRLFAPDGEEHLRLQATKVENRRFSIANLAGDDLLLSRRAEP